MKICYLYSPLGHPRCEFFSVHLYRMSLVIDKIQATQHFESEKHIQQYYINTHGYAHSEVK